MAKGFDSDFYVTCATVIPVLYLALVVQGGTYDVMLKTALQAAAKSRKRQRDYAAANLLPATAYVTLVAAAIGEIAALGALFSESNVETTKVLIFVSVLILIGAAMVIPATRWFIAQAQTSDLLADSELNNPVGGQHAKTPRKSDGQGA
jgi:hypothetical protein